MVMHFSIVLRISRAHKIDCRLGRSWGLDPLLDSKVMGLLNRAHGNLSLYFTTARASTTAVGVTIFFMKEERQWSNSNLIGVLVIIICLLTR